MKSFLIIGMGTFGHQLCKALAEQNCELMIVDIDGSKLEDMIPDVVSSRIGDCTKPEVLRSFGIDHFDACFVCMGRNFLASLQITSLLKEMRAKKVFTKADRDVEEKFYLRNGADVVIHPEKEIAERYAILASSDNVFDVVRLLADYIIAEIVPQHQWIGRTIRELELRSRFHLMVLAVKNGSQITTIPDADYRFTEAEHVFVLGRTDDIRKLER